MSEDPAQPPSLSFGRVADSYDRYRPSFPSAAVEWALGADPVDVLDVGAGTGLMTRVLHDAGHHVTALEPDGRMRERLERRCPECRVLEGVAERVPLGDGSVDAVVAAEAYHWFDHATALPELARVLRPHGFLVIVWNVLDTSVGWVSDFENKLAEVIPRPGGGTGSDLIPSVWFEAPEESGFAHTHATDLDGLVGMIGTWSPVITSQDPDRILDAVREFVVDHPDLSPSRIDVPYVTRVVRLRAAAG